MFWNFNWVIVLIICLTVSSIVSTWIRAKHGYPRERGGRRGRFSQDELEEVVADALAERDAVIARLEERIRVLERIVTDRAHGLRDEIDRLAG